MSAQNVWKQHKEALHTLLEKVGPAHVSAIQIAIESIEEVDAKELESQHEIRKMAAELTHRAADALDTARSEDLVAHEEIKGHAKYYRGVAEACQRAHEARTKAAASFRIRTR